MPAGGTGSRSEVRVRLSSRDAFKHRPRAQPSYTPSSMTTDSIQTLHSLRLRVPLEVLERIIQLACEQPLATPFSPAPRLPPVSLLLVSQGVSQLALSHYYRSITIRNPSDWSSLLDPTHGLLVVGELASRRRQAVVELVIRCDAIPIDTARVHPLVAASGGDALAIDDYYIPLAPVSLPNVARVCLLGGVRTAQSVAEREISRRLWAAIPRNTAAGKDLTGLVSNVVGDKVGGSLAQKLKARRAEIFQDLLGSAPIKTVHLTLLHDDLRHIYARPCPTASLWVHTSPADFEDQLCNRSYAGAGRPDAICSLVDLSCGEQDVVVVGLDDTVRDKLEGVAKRHSCRNMFSVETREDGSLSEPKALVA